MLLLGLRRAARFAAAAPLACGVFAVFARGQAEDGWSGTPTAGGGAYSTYGQGCTGTGSLLAACDGNNGSGGTLAGLALANEYAYGVVATTASIVVGFELFVASATGNVECTGAALYREDPVRPGFPRTAMEAVGVIAAEPTPGFYRCILVDPVAVAAGEAFWVSQYDTQRVRAADLTAGNPPLGTTCWRRPPASLSPWAASTIVRFPAFRVLCFDSASQRGEPEIAAAELPTLGAQFSVVLAQAAPGAPAILLFGSSDAGWGGLQLPLDLQAFGAPGCFLNASADLSLFARDASAVGTARVSLLVPNDPGLAGATFVNQWTVLDGTNPLGLTFSKGGRGVIN
jgi:hypothetical protein